MTQRIDSHFHIIPEFFAEALENAGRRSSNSKGLPDWSPDLALRTMDDHGIGTAITSISAPGVHFGDNGMARALARRCNEYAAELRSRWPSRFGAFGTLPLPDVEGACKEIAFTLDVLKFDGVCLLASYGEAFLGDDDFTSVMEMLNERGAVIFLHPNIHATAKPKSKWPAFIVEFPIDTTRAAINLILSRSLQRFPKIRFVLAHAGGALPYLATRLQLAPLIDPQFQSWAPDELAEQLRRLWFDTALSVGDATLAALQKIALPNQIVFGSDWPYAPIEVLSASIRGLAESSSITPALRHAVERTNSLTLFPDLRN